MFQQIARINGPRDSEEGRFGFAPLRYASLLRNGVWRSVSKRVASCPSGCSDCSSCTNSSKESVCGFEKLTNSCFSELGDPVVAKHNANRTAAKNHSARAPR